MSDSFLTITINYCVEKPANKPNFTRSIPTGFEGDLHIVESWSQPSYFVTAFFKLNRVGTTDDLLEHLYRLTSGKLLFHATAMLYVPESGPRVFHSTAFGWEEVTEQAHSRLPAAISYALNKPLGDIASSGSLAKRKNRYH